MRFHAVHQLVLEVRKWQTALSPADIRRVIGGRFAYVWIDASRGLILASAGLSHGRMVADNPEWFKLEKEFVTPDDDGDDYLNDFYLGLTHHAMEHNSALVRIEISDGATRLDMEGEDIETVRRALRLLIEKHDVDFTKIKEIRVDVNTGHYRFATLSNDDIEEFAGHGPPKRSWFRDLKRS